MSDINSSLIGFLKKKSLFATSPDKNKRLRQSSRDSKQKNEPHLSQKNISYNPEYKQEPMEIRNHKNLQKHNSVQHFTSIQFDSASQISLSNEAPIRYQNTSPQQKNKGRKREFNFEKTEENRGVDEKTQENTKNIWAGMITKAITFESARIESAQCLDNLMIKMQTQISSINYKIDAFRSKMSQILDQQFANLHQKIVFMVDKILQESSSNIKSYIKEQEKALAADLIAMREILIKEYQKVEVMKEQINKPNWRKVAGELLSSQLEQKIDEIVLQSKSLSVKHWEVKDLGSDKIPNLERELRNIVKLSIT